jgi:hypothetical protein
VDDTIPIVEDLPEDARKVIEKAAREIEEVNEQVRKQVALVRKKADKKVEELTAEGRDKVRARLEKVVAALKPLQVAYAKDGLLDEALAIRDQIRQLRTDTGDAQPDPGNLVAFQTQIGQSFSFSVTGQTGGPLWGTDVYTTDSALACAAVHAGKVRPGERKVVRVTIVTPPPGFQGSTRNGVTSSAYGPYPGAYRVE